MRFVLNVAMGLSVVLGFQTATADSCGKDPGDGPITIGGVASTTGTTTTTQGGTPNWDSWCPVKKSYLNCQIQNANNVCKAQVPTSIDAKSKSIDLTGCQGDVASGCAADDSGDPVDPTDLPEGTTPDCKQQMADTYCCQKESDQKAMSSADESANKAQKAIIDGTAEEQKNENEKTKEITDARTHLSQAITQLQAKNDQILKQYNADMSAAQAAIDHAKTEQKLNAVKVASAQRRWKAATKAAFDACAAAHDQFKAQGNAFQFGGINQGLSSVGKGGLVLGQCDPGSVGTDAARKYAEALINAQNDYYDTVNPLVVQNSDDDYKVQKLIRDLVNVDNNKNIDLAGVQRDRNNIINDTNQQIQAATQALQQLRVTGQQNAQALQAQYQKALALQKQANSDYQKSQGACNALQGFRKSTSCSSASTTPAVNDNDPHSVAAAGVRAQEIIRHSPHGCGGGDTWTGDIGMQEAKQNNGGKVQ